MGSDGSSCHPWYCAEKVWDPDFSEDPDIQEDTSHVAWKTRELEVDFDGIIRTFWQDAADSEPSYGVEMVEDFFQRDGSDDRRLAWLDDRSNKHTTKAGEYREYPNPLTAAELGRYLRESV